MPLRLIASALLLSLLLPAAVRGQDSELPLALNLPTAKVAQSSAFRSFSPATCE